MPPRPWSTVTCGMANASSCTSSIQARRPRRAMHSHYGATALESGCDSAGRSMAAQELSHVVTEEQQLVGCVNIGQRFLELGERVAPALGMGIVGREHEQFGPRLFHHPPDRLSRERRE